jgi:hypothetical protein
MAEQVPPSPRPPPVLPYGGGPPIVCPYCGWPQLYPQRKPGITGIVILILGICLIILGVPCLAFAFIGVYPIAAGLLIGFVGVVLMLSMRRAVNRCGRCGRVF